jgi:imidazolonepropionase-like amidohydrolase
MYKLGMTAHEALLAATAVNAKILRRADDLGQVAEGFLADLIAVPGNPASDLNVLGDIRLVMKNGAVEVRS